MKTAVRLSSGWAFLIGLVLIPAALAENEQLQIAKSLFDKQEYVAAQEALLAVDRDELSEAEAEVYERLLKVLGEAVPAGKKAEQDMADANKAYQAGHWKEADQLYGRVIDNAYAQAASVVEARAQRQRIAEKLELAEAAKPAGPVPEQPPTESEKPPPVPAEPEVAEPVPPPVPLGPRRATLADELRARDDLLWQRAVAKMQEAVQKAGDAVAAERFDEARQLAESALQVIEGNRAYAQPPSKYEAARALALELKKQVAEEYDRWSRRKAEEQRTAIAEQIERRRRSQEQQRREKVEQLFNTAEQLQKEQRFREAAEAMRQVLILDPANAKASFWLDTYEDFSSFHEQKEVAQEIARQTQHVLQRGDEARIPWSQDILYPKNWQEIVQRREGAMRGVAADEDFEYNRMLESVQPEINFMEQPLDQVVDFLTDINQMNIVVDWEDLRNSGIDRDKPVTMRLKDITLRTVLGELLGQVGGEVPLSFATGDGLLRIATKEKLDRDKYILVYDIRDLLIDVPHFNNAPQLELPGQGPGGADVGTVGPGMSLFGSQRNSEDDEEAVQEKGKDELVEKVMDIVRNTIEPDSRRFVSSMAN
jgi:hypothetical protein